MRFLGVFLFLLGGGGTAYATFMSYERERPLDVVFAVLAPIALVIALVGLVLVFVPGFFG